MIELYGITRHPGPALPALAPLRLVAGDGLAIVCVPAGGDEDTTAQALWRHEAVVEALMEDRDVLPVRYGTRLADEAAARRVLAERHDEFAGALRRIEGAFELSVRCALASQAETASAAASGAAYVARKTRAAAAADEAARAVHDPLALLARESRSRTPRGPAEILRAAYLVDRDGVDGFTRRVGELQTEHARLRLLCTGPWPPYSFVAP